VVVLATLIPSVEAANAVKVEQQFGADAASVRAARQFVVANLAELPQQTIDDAELIVSELAANAVTHARSHFDIWIDRDDDDVRIEVRDHGDGSPVVRSPSPEAAYGRGLHIVDELSRDWGVSHNDDGSKTVWVEVGSGKKLKPSRSQGTSHLEASVRFDDLVPGWLFAVKSRVARLVIAIGVPAAAAAIVMQIDHPPGLRLGPLFAVALIAIAVLCGGMAVTISSVLFTAIYWWYDVPTVRSVHVASSAGWFGIAGVVILATGLSILALRLEGVVEDVRALDSALREQTVAEAKLRQRAERTASQAEAVLRLGRAIGSAHTVAAVAQKTLEALEVPARPMCASIATVEENGLRLLASMNMTPQQTAGLEHVNVARSAWLGGLLAGRPAYVEERAEFATQYPRAQVLRLFDSGSWAVLPFRAEDTVGLLSVHYPEPRPLRESELYFSLVSELLGTSLERAKSEEQQRQQHLALEHAFAERDRIARTLSTTLLPPNLPRLAGFSASGFIVPASEDELAGDFYDLFAVSDGGWVGVLGDVCGKGAEAAAVTSLARYAIRASALDNPDPSDVARVANQALVADPSDLFCTAAIVRSLNGGATVEVTLAGHLQVRQIVDGEVSRLGVYGAALGLATHPPQSRRYDMPRGSKVVLFSDGIVERDPSFREADFDAFLARTTAETAQELAGEIRRLLAQLREVHPDDVAVLVIHRT
jgi:sigma-B regulation protein RsbU (phosphoserine phosphatase)